MALLSVAANDSLPDRLYPTTMALQTDESWIMC
jgi:hypothetical protein